MKVFTFIAQALSDGENPSGMRLVTVSGALAILGTWTVISLGKHALQDLPSGVVTVFGLLIAGKVWQSHIESKPPAP